ncbi:MAG: nucleotidyltransferase family protein, partial [Bacteroidales bacterium]|nr:nucleotidyltransferase family protein [Bacteroidales bacterium]
MNLHPQSSEPVSEHKLVFNACRYFSNANNKNLLQQLLCEDVNWEIVQRLSNLHLVTPIVYHVLKDLDHENKIPKTILQILKRTYKQTVMCNLGLFSTLNSVLRVFNENAISVILLKGAVLADDLYNNIGLRHMSDIDVLVKHDQMDEVNTALSKVGCRPEPLYQWHIQRNIRINYINTRSQRLQVHWEVLHGDSFSQNFLPLPNDILWQNTMPITCDTQSALSIEHTVNALYLCLHTAKHSMWDICLAKFLDIALFIKKYDESIDKERFWQLAQASGQVQLIRDILALTERYLSLPISILDKAISQKKIINLSSGQPRRDKNHLISMNIARIICEVDGLVNKIRCLIGYFFPHPNYITYK